MNPNATKATILVVDADLDIRIYLCNLLASSGFDVIDAGSRVHSWHLNDAMKTINEAGSGVIILLHRTEDGAALLAHLDERPQAPSKLDLRTYGIGAQILRDLGVTRMRLLSEPRRMPSMTGFDLEITGYMHPR